MTNYEQRHVANMLHMVPVSQSFDRIYKKN